jgi:hypothetical protein
MGWQREGGFQDNQEKAQHKNHKGAQLVDMLRQMSLLKADFGKLGRTA